MRKLSATHWTPVAVARKAADFLVTCPTTKVLDLGSGAGKFCVVAAMNTQAMITGVEQRENLIHISEKLASHFNVENVKFIHTDLKNIIFENFDAFYFFNSFEEKVNLQDKIDSDNSFEQVEFTRYNNFLLQELDKVSIGTRVVTYCGQGDVIPDSYILLRSDNKGKLLFWEKRY